ncbi:MAG TPA: hypothetical protein VGH74_16000 [Planctomycetaceae bacterium]|jgi:WD40 repeat protein
MRSDSAESETTCARCRAARIVWIVCGALCVASLAHSSNKALADDASRIDHYGDPLSEGAQARLGTGRLRHHSSAMAVAFSPDGKVLATGGWDGSIKLCEFPGGKPIRLFRASERPNGIFGLAFSPDGAKLAATCDQGLVYLFDIETGNESIKNKVARGERTFGVAYAPDGRAFASAGGDGFVRMWESSTGREVFNFNVPGPGVRDQFAVAYSPDGSLLAAGYSSVIVIIDTRRQSTLVTIPQAHGGQTVAMAFAPDGKALVSGGFKDYIPGGAEIRVWNVADGALLRELSPGSSKAPGPSKVPGPSKDLGCALALSRDGKTLVTGHDARLLVWDFPEGRVIRSLAIGDAGAVNPGLRTHGVAVSPDGKSVASISHGNRVRVWNAGDGEPILDYPESHAAGVEDVAWFHDGRQLVSASQDRTVRRWDAAAGRQTEIVDRCTWAFWQVAITPDARTIVTAGEGQERSEGGIHGILRFIDAETNERLAAKSLDSIVTALAISPDGTILAAAQGRGKSRFDPENGSPVVISLWDVASRRQIGSLRGHTQKVMALRFSADGKTLLSAAEDGTVRRWDVQHQRFLTARVLKETVRNPKASEDKPEDKSEPARLMAAGLTPDLETAVLAVDRRDYLSIQELSAGGRNVRIEFPNFAWSQSNIAVTQDGRFAAIAGGRFFEYDNSIWVVDLANGRKLHEFKPDDWPDTLRFSSDGKRLACGTRIGTILIYDLPDAAGANTGHP